MHEFFSVIQGNSADNTGGAIHAAASSIILAYTTVNYNTAPQGSGLVCMNSYYNFVKSSVHANQHGNQCLENCQFEGIMTDICQCPNQEFDICSGTIPSLHILNTSQNVVGTIHVQENVLVIHFCMEIAQHYSLLCRGTAIDCTTELCFNAMSIQFPSTSTEISQLEPSTATEDIKEGSPATADSASIVPWIIIAIIAALLIVGIVLLIVFRNKVKKVRKSVDFEH